MAKSATLAINIISDASGARKGLEQATASVDDFKRGLDRASLGAAATVGAIGLLGKSAFDAASAMQQSTGSVDAVFGAQADQIKQSAEGAAKGVGLSTQAYQEQAAVMGAMLRNTGVAADQLAPTTEKLIGMGADLAAVYGGTAKDAVEALSSALRGETDPIERYGISIKQSTIDAALATQGLTSATATQAQKTATLLGLIQQQGAPALGQWSAQMGTAAEQTQIAGATWDSATAKLGQGLVPVVATAADWLSKFSGWAQNNSGTVTTLAYVIGGLAAAILLVNAGVKIYETYTTLATAAQWLFNTALDANPIGLVVLAVAGLVALIVLLVNHFGGFQNVLKATGQVFSTIWDAMLTVMQPVIDVVKWLWGKFMDLIHFGQKIAGWVGGLFSAPAAAPAGAALGRGLYGAAPGLRAAGLLTAGTGTGGGAGVLGGGGGGSARTAPAQVVNITVQGALDPTAVADQVQSLLDRNARNLGRRPPLTAGRAR